jgi:hypothetical protein
MPKCRARQVTVSPSAMSPLVTPAIARSADGPIEAACASTDNDSSKHAVTEALMIVSRRIDDTVEQYCRPERGRDPSVRLRFSLTRVRQGTSDASSDSGYPRDRGGIERASSWSVRMRGVGEMANRGFLWREQGYPRQRWRRLFVRTVAQADVIAPDGRPYIVRVVRVLWPRRGGLGLVTGSPVDAVEVLPTLVATRVVWGVRVLAGSARYPLRPLVYGQELRRREDALFRAREIAEGLSQGRRP